MKVVKGDLLQLFEKGNFDIIIHGCNCFNTMGAGIAKQIKNKYPKVYEADLKTSRGDIKKLGTIEFIPVKKDPIAWIVNAYTQFKYNGKPNSILVDYEDIRKCFKSMKHRVNVYHKFHSDIPFLRIGYPMIGAGLAGGDWEVISKIIDEELEGLNHTLVIYDKG